MKIHDQALWQAQKAEIAARSDADVGQLFLDFAEAWCDASEELMPVMGHIPIEALRDTFEDTQSVKGFVPPGWLGQLLLVICSNWAFGGDQLFDDMTPLEKRFVTDAAFIIEDAANLQARTVPDGPAN